MGGVLKWVTFWRGRRASVGDVGDVLLWEAWMAFFCRWRASVGSVGGVLV